MELGQRAIYHATFRDAASGGTVSGEGPDCAAGWRGATAGGTRGNAAWRALECVPTCSESSARLLLCSARHVVASALPNCVPPDDHQLGETA